jgi:hypothetical protein
MVVAAVVEGEALQGGFSWIDSSVSQSFSPALYAKELALVYNR